MPTSDQIGWRGRLTRAWLRFGRPLGHLLFPRECVGCGATDAGGDGVLCRPCRGAMGSLRRGFWCRRCGQSVGPFAATEPCSDCGSRKLPWLAGVLRVGRYAPPLAGVVLALKYGGRAELAEPLGDWLTRRVGWTPVDAVCPIPLHPNREWARGYNQAGLLAAAVAGRLRQPLCADLVRVRDTPQQTAGAFAERVRNIAEAFELSPRADRARIAGRRYLLIDDVMTTGATASEAAGVLRRAGAARVTLLVLAVAERPQLAPTEEAF